MWECFGYMQRYLYRKLKYYEEKALIMCLILSVVLSTHLNQFGHSQLWGSFGTQWRPPVTEDRGRVYVLFPPNLPPSGPLQRKQISDQILQRTHRRLRTQTQGVIQYTLSDSLLRSLCWAPCVTILLVADTEIFSPGDQLAVKSASDGKASSQRWDTGPNGTSGWGTRLQGMRLLSGTAPHTSGGVCTLLVSSHILDTT